MKKILYIFICGFLGAFVRSLFYKIPFINPSLPYSTLMVNLIGAFFLSLLTFLALKEIKIGKELHTGITTGFLGAFTTFSTFSKDIFTIIQKGNIGFALIYISISIVGGILFVFLGYLLVEKLSIKFNI